MKIVFYRFNLLLTVSLTFAGIVNCHAQIGFNKIINDTVKLNTWQNVYISADSFKNSLEFQITHFEGDSVVSFQLVVDPIDQNPFLIRNNGAIINPVAIQRLKRMQSGDRLIIDMIKVKQRNNGIITNAPTIIYYITD